MYKNRNVTGVQTGVSMASQLRHAARCRIATDEAEAEASEEVDTKGVVVVVAAAGKALSTGDDADPALPDAEPPPSRARGGGV